MRKKASMYARKIKDLPKEAAMNYKKSGGGRTKILVMSK
jgi:hypothetical protein